MSWTVEIPVCNIVVLGQDIGSIVRMDEHTLTVNI